MYAPFAAMSTKLKSSPPILYAPCAASALMSSKKRNNWSVQSYINNPNQKILKQFT